MRFVEGVLRWVLMMTALLFLAVWLATAWWEVRCRRWGPLAMDWAGVSVGCGVVVFQYAESPIVGTWGGSILPGFEWRTRRVSPRDLRWWFAYRRPMFPVTKAFEAQIPLWAPMFLVGAPAAWLWRRCACRPSSHCICCGYDMRGLGAQACPECGCDLCLGRRG